MSNEQVSVYLGLGTNLGDRRKNLEQALIFLGQRLKLAEKSAVYDTTPEENPNQPRFLNMVCRVYTTIAPEGLLAILKGIEAKMGRTPGKVNSPRPIDIDILFYGSEVINKPKLIIPHPKVSQRAFVLVPLAEIAPDLIHPVTHQKVSRMLADLRHGIQGVFKFEETKNTLEEG
jgi:2-amino-4-hydroxy-6-hydroxymethyldihydropteridine diphosphokinase